MKPRWHGRARAAGLVAAAVIGLVGLTGCGNERPSEGEATPLASAGQVKPVAAAAQPSHYAAARFAEQTTFGPTPELIAEIRSKGFERWIDEQLALPPTQMDAAQALIDGNPIPAAAFAKQAALVQHVIYNAPDQLRARWVWSLGQFITVSGTKGHPYGLIQWVNMLNRQAFGTYGDLLYQVSVHPFMGQYLDNNQNRPRSAQCPRCAPNENYARELLQLFSVGVIRLEADGTPTRNALGKYLETYTQTDVEELARALTGWQFDTDPFSSVGYLSGFSKPMIVSKWAPDRDSGAKRILGRNFPAGQSGDKDLRDVVDLLMAHPNIAPFVALRLIQHHVKSNPSPAYVGRVAAAFRNNGQGVAGDLKAVVKAVLLDAEARAGDDPAKAARSDGLLREPVLHRSALYRAMGCKRPPENAGNASVGANNYYGYRLNTQQHWSPDSVFSFYAPTDRAPGSNLLAPEQKLITAAELTSRFGDPTWAAQDPVVYRFSFDTYRAAGCQVDPLLNAFKTSPRAFIDLLATMYFRGAMPPQLRSMLEQMMRNPTWNAASQEEGVLRLLTFALATPYFGALL